MMFITQFYNEDEGDDVFVLVCVVFYLLLYLFVVGFRNPKEENLRVKKAQ